MRKTIISLILVIPMVFVLVVFSSVNLIALGVDISVNGIRLYAEDAEDGTIYIDMADEREYAVKAEVTPGNAKNKAYMLTSADPSVAEVTQDGKILPKSEGTAKITATSADKGFTDSLSVVVAASKPYDVSFSVFDGAGSDLLTETETGYSATLETGRYRYAVAVAPREFGNYTFKAESGTTAVIEEGSRTMLLPFSGDASFTVTVPDGVRGTIEKSVSLRVVRPQSQTGILLDGFADYETVVLDRAARTVQVYVECDAMPVFTPPAGHEGEIRATVEPLAGVAGRYRLTVQIGESFAGDHFTAAVSSGGKSAELGFTFEDFDYRLTSDAKLETEGGVTTAAIAVGSDSRFYAVSTVAGADVTYEWTLENGQEYLTVSEDTATCTVRAGAAGEYKLHVRAMRNGAVVGEERELILYAVENIGAVRITNAVNVDLAEAYTIAGYAYDGSLKAVRSNYALKVYTFTPGKPLAAGGDELSYSVSDPTVARVERTGGAVTVVPLGEGQVTVTAEWKWNGAFGKNLRATITLNVLPDAIFVTSAPEYMQAMREKRVTVLKNDISLGTDQSGNVLDLAVRENMLAGQRFKSTYNIEWYRHTDLVAGGETLTEDDAYLSYASEITNDLYGNGFSIDADAFTHALDGNDTPLLKQYRGPLYFVEYKQIASVAGQDNCAFLIREKGIRLYGVNLLGCKDESLLSDAGGYDLTNLNLVGTTLEVNADCDIVNCRIRNGRNVVRAYGGNRDGNNYFLDSLSSNAGCAEERIHVNIEGCILSQGREFILKMGANRALRASLRNGAEPYLCDRNGVPYSAGGTSNWYDLLDNAAFYDDYVLTDVTLKNSVLETSGLFTVGVESNFAGIYLYEGAGEHRWSSFTKSWEYSGGTSFASVLRLEGDVRLYDWKDIDLVDSSTLIESPVGQLSEWLKLDIKKMLNYVYNTDPGTYGDVIEERDGKQFVHGGIAYYGGGRNYSQLDTRDLDEKYRGFSHYRINISVLGGSSDASMQQQGTILPNAAGKNDFNFFLYGKNSATDYAAQLRDEANHAKYSGVRPVGLFG